MSSGRFLTSVALAGAILSCALTWTLLTQNKKIQVMRSSIETLQASLEAKERELKLAPPHSPDRASANEGTREGAGIASSAPASLTGSYQLLKELESDSATDPRSSAEKLQALLASNPTDEAAAIACRFIFNQAADRQDLPDYALQAIYSSQGNPDLRRVIAQVMSQRGDDGLLKDQISEAQTALKSAKPKDRLDALSQLGKIHSVQAVDAITPSLQDSDSTVRVAALFALRDSGNQKHIHLVEPLTRDPDPSVSTLAGNVLSALKNLSSSARTSYSRADIEAELPPMANP